MWMTFLKAAKPLKLINYHTGSLLLTVFFCAALLHFSCHRRTARTADMNENDNMRNIVITHIAGGSYCGIEESKTKAVTSASDWEEIWAVIHRDIRPERAAPEIDFSRETVVGVFLGTRSTGGYSVEIIDASLHNGKLEVIYKTKSPSPGDMVSMAITQPFHVISVNVTGAEIEFIRQEP